MVLAQYPAAAGEGVVLELASLLVLAQLGQVYGEIAGRFQDVGMVLTQQRATQAQRPFEQRPGGDRFPMGQHIRSGVVEQPGDVVPGRIGGVAGIGGGKDVREQLSPEGPGRRVVPGIGRNHSTEQPDRDDGHIVLVRLGAQHGLQ